MVRARYSRHKVGLEFVQIDVKRAIKAEGCRNRRHDLGNKAIQVREAGRRDTQALFADVVNSFIINLQDSD